jgi:hypothetical protein
METVGENRDRPREVPEAHLRDRDDQIEDENAAENADDGLVTFGQFKIQNANCKRYLVFAL